MSVRTGFAIVGTAVGAYFGNAQLGYAIGSVVGGMVDPVRSFGPRIDDAKTQTAQPGAPISLVWGAARVAGNIIACGPLKQHKHTDDGKSGQEAITYTYTRTYAVGVCAGPVHAIRRVWRDNKLVYDATPDRDEKTRIANRQFTNRLAVYLGDETQEPDPELQAILGEDNVPAFRGLCYFVIRDDDLTDRGGSVPAYTVEVVTNGSSITNGEYKPLALVKDRFWDAGAQGKADPRQDGQVYEYRYRDTSVTTEWGTFAETLDYFVHNVFPEGKTDACQIEQTLFPVGWGQARVAGQSRSTSGWPVVQAMAPYEDPGTPARIISLIFQRQNQGGDEDVTVLYTDAPSQYNSGKWGRRVHRLSTAGSSTLYGSGTVSSAAVRPDYNDTINQSIPPVFNEDIVFLGDAWFDVRAVPFCVEGTPESDWLLVPGTTDLYVDRLGNLHDLSACTEVEGDFVQLAVISDTQVPVGPVLLSTDPNNTQIFWESAYDLARISGDVPSGWEYGVQYPSSVGAACFCQRDTETDSDGVPLRVIVKDLLNKTGVSDSQMDVSQLVDVVDGFVVSSTANCADSINALAPAFQFGGAEWDAKINFVKLGLPTVEAVIDTLSVDDGDGQRVLETRSQEITVPRKLTLTYQDQSSNYAPVTQTAERYRVTVDAVGELSLSTPVVMGTDKAAQMADILLKDQWSSVRGTLAQRLPDEYSYLTPTDVIFVTSDEAVFRARLTEVEVGAGILSYNSIQDMANAYSSTATGVPPIPPADGPVSPIGPTLAYYLNIPALRDKDDQPGFYVAAAGFFDGWGGALIEYSVDGGLNWIGSMQIRQESSLGVTLTALPAWTPLIPDEEHTVDVVMTSGQLASVTQGALDQGANAAWLNGEVLQFRTATLIDDNTYRLSGLVRGRKYTPHGAHAEGSGFAVLDSVYFLPINRSQIGATFTLRATTSGASTADGAVSTLTLTRDWSVTEWPVTNLSGYRDTDHTAHLSWSPRHRLGNAAAPYASLYFTGYRVSISDGSASKSYDVSAQTFDYTDAQATNDFGSTGPFTFAIYALNSITGPSDPTEVEL